MTNKYNDILELSTNTLSEIIKNQENWKAFLTTAGRLYKYPFEEQLLIYAQKPDAIACASIEIWNQYMNRWVNKGSKGIALIDNKVNYPKLKYVFDVSDTHKARMIGKDLNLWELEDRHQEPVLARLEKLYGKTDDRLSFEDRLIEIADKITLFNLSEVVNELKYQTKDTWLEELDEKNLEIRVRETMKASISYMILSRCGIDVDEEKLDFSYIHEFNGTEILSKFGGNISEITKMALMDIGKTIKDYENNLEKTSTIDYNTLKYKSVSDTEKIQEGGQTNDVRISAERGLSNSKLNTSGRGEENPEQIREDEKDLPSGTKTGNIQQYGLNQQIIQSSVSDTGTGRGANGTIDKADDGERRSERGTKSERPDALGTENEQYSSFSRGDSIEGAYLQLSLFPTVEQQKTGIEIGAGKELAPFSVEEGREPTKQKYSYLSPKYEKDIPEEYIREALLHGSGFVGGKFRLEKMCHSDISPQERAKAIKKEYGQGGAGWPLEGNGLHGYDSFQAKGFHLQWRDDEGEKEGYITWAAVEERIRYLVERREYISDEERERYAQSQLDKVKEELDEGLSGQLIEHNQGISEEYNSWDEDKKAEVADIKNFHISDYHLGIGTDKEKFRMNIEAVKTLKNIENEKRYATPEEQKILSNYVGWGGLSNAFDESKSNWAKEFCELKSLLSEEEYRSARESTLNAHYTSPNIIRGIYDTLEKMGFVSGNVLEPSCGVGNFLGMLPESMKDSKLYGVELDSVSGRIAKQLYPEAKIQITGFEKTNFPNDFFDVAIGNVPFGQYKVSDRAYDKHNFLIHDYFIAKTLDKVRAGGVIAVVTSKGTMDKQNAAARKYIAQRAELLGAVRLPNTAFKNNAGTEVTSDILFFQKRDRFLDVEPEWVNLKENKDGILLNSYFVNHPEMIVGKMEMVSGPYGMEATCTADNERPFLEQLQDALSNISGHYEAIETDLEELNSDYANLPAIPDVKNYSYTVIDDKVYYRENSVMKPANVSDAVGERIKGMVAIRDCTQELIRYQLEEYDNGFIQEKQAELNQLYDKFQTKYGLINSQTNKRAFHEDSSYCLLCSLEQLNEDGTFKGKADMFSKRTIKKQEVITSVDTPNEALAVSLGERAKVDLSFMAQLTGRSETEVAKELSGVIFLNPEKEVWETADEYLSGNVREKLETARSFAKNRPEYNVNVSFLEKVQPKELDASEIEIRIGATWINPKYINDFMKEVFQTPEYLLRRDVVGVQFSELTGTWNIKGKNADYNNPITGMTYGTSRVNAYKILEDSLNLKDTRVFDVIVENGKESRVLNKKETTLASQKQEAMREEFKNWIFKDQQRREELCAKYNRLFNSTRPREFDGSHLSFPGMTPEITLKPHQKNAVAHVLYGNNTLLAHCVGAGKTFEMIAAAMESKRIGLAQKSLFVVPNHLTEQWGSDFLRLYPGANILVATKKDFEPANRKKFCARIATGDYDAVIIGHTQYEKIPLSQERQATVIKKQIDEITEEIAAVKASNGEKYTIKEMEKTKKSLMVRLDKLNDQSRKDDVVTFEQLGVDRLFVDESHSYKNLFLYTKMRNVAGITQTEAQKSSDMFAKCQYMDEITGGKGITFATGTPISNSMTELYTNMRYLQYNTLEKMGLRHFDSWASSFGETQTAIELAPEGTGYRAKTRFAKFYNLPELISLFKECADIQTPDMLKLPVPEVEYHNQVLKPSEHQKELVKSLADRAECVRAGSVDASEDNMLKITNDGRKLALDQRLINDILPNDVNSKSSVCVEKAFEIWEKTKEQKSTQLIFCDLSTPKGDGSFNVYDDIKNKLMEKGVPKDEITFIHEANTEIKKAELFAKVRSGQVRFLIGSTAKMGAGTNVQDKLIALHHLDVPWRPSDIEQQEGRILRQGNQNKKVDIFRYVTEGTFDSYSWQLIENKQKFIGQIMTSKSPVRSCEDVDEAALSYAEVKALATGNKYIKEKMDLDIQVSKLKLLKANHTSQIYRLEDDIAKRYPQRINAITEKIKGYQMDIEHYSKVKPDNMEDFSMMIGNKIFTDKKEAGIALIDVCRSIKSPDGQVSVGEYLGFKLTASFDCFDNKFTVAMKGALSHPVEIGSDPLGNITRLNNGLASMEREYVEIQESLVNVQKQFESAKIEVTKPFPQETELANKLERLAELNALLNMDEKGETKEGKEIESKMEKKEEHSSKRISIKEKLAENKNISDMRKKDEKIMKDKEISI